MKLLVSSRITLRSLSSCRQKLRALQSTQALLEAKIVSVTTMKLPVSSRIAVRYISVYMPQRNGSLSSYNKAPCFAIYSSPPRGKNSLCDYDETPGFLSPCYQSVFLPTKALCFTVHSSPPQGKNNLRDYDETPGFLSHCYQSVFLSTKALCFAICTTPP
jgi:hypothetical protein